MRSIAANGPPGPGRPVEYSWDGDDCGQVNLAEEAVRYGVERIFASPVSAPWYMLDCGPGQGGGTVRGMPGGSEGEDWRSAFAAYLLQYVRFYADSGVQITDLGFANQPDLLLHHPDRVARFPLLQLRPHQAVDFVKVLGRAVEQAGIPVRIVCANALSWESQAGYTAAVEADEEAARYVAVHGAQNYRTRARRPLDTGRPMWMTEWDPSVTGHQGALDWDSGDCCDGIRLAEDVHDALTMAGVSGYLYLFGASARARTSALIRVDADDYRVSARFWALAAFSRFIRPSSCRIGVTLADAGDGLKVSAFATPDGDVVVNLLNLRPDTVGAVVHPPAGYRVAGLRRWLTDASHSLTALAPPTAGGVSLPGRSLTTLVWSTPRPPSR
jgi:O-glycosyl hydrolase